MAAKFTFFCQFFTIAAFCLVLGFSIAIQFASSLSIAEYRFNSNGNETFSIFYKNEMKIIELVKDNNNNNSIEVKTLSLCSFNEIQLSENKSCGIITGLYDLDLLKENNNKINILLNITWVFTLILLIIYIIIWYPMIDILLSKSSQLSTKQNLISSFKKRYLLLNYYSFTFFIIIILVSLLFSRFYQYEYLFKNITGFKYYSSNKFLISIMLFTNTCFAASCLIISAIIYYSTIDKNYITSDKISNDKSTTNLKKTP